MDDLHLPARREGKLDMFVTNQFDQLFRAVLGAVGIGVPPWEGPNSGWMTIENVDVVGSFLGKGQAGLVGQGDLGMVFRAANPVWEILAHLPETLITFAASGAGPLVDAAMSAKAALDRWADAMKWSNPTDPLVIDLDGDGIETLSLSDTSIYFDVDGDLFAERTGWLKGDDGFLVLDANGNGRIDDVGEMFGGVGLSGFAELATLDADGDGKISAADVVWAELKVWQDLDRDGVTDTGELKSLSDLGIVSLDVAAQAIDVTTPQGARLTGWGDVTFASGTTRRMFDGARARTSWGRPRAGALAHRRIAAAACNDNSAWPERPFRLLAG